MFKNIQISSEKKENYVSDMSFTAVTFGQQKSHANEQEEKGNLPVFNKKTECEVSVPTFSGVKQEKKSALSSNETEFNFVEFKPLFNQFKKLSPIDKKIEIDDSLSFESVTFGGL